MHVSQNFTLQGTSNNRIFQKSCIYGTANIGSKHDNEIKLTIQTSSTKMEKDSQKGIVLE